MVHMHVLATAVPTGMAAPVLDPQVAEERGDEDVSAADHRKGDGHQSQHGASCRARRRLSANAEPILWRRRRRWLGTLTLYTARCRVSELFEGSNKSSSRPWRCQDPGCIGKEIPR